MADYYNKPLMTVKDVKSYNISSIYDISAEEAVDFWKNVEHSICELSEFDEARAERILAEFVENDSKIYIITNRHEKYREITEKWLERHAFTYDELIMTGGKSKVNVLRDLNIDVMVDDKPDLFYEVEEAGLDTIMVCVDYEFNKDVPCDLRMTLEGEVLNVR